MIIVKINFPTILVALGIFLTNNPVIAQESSTETLSIQSPLAPYKKPPFNGKQTIYTKEGKLHTITHYRKGQMVRYRDYFQDGSLFQDIRYHQGIEHGKYLMYNEVAEIVLEGKKRNGNPHSGQFDKWDTEISEYRILTYRRGKLTCNRLLSELLPETVKTTNQINP